MNNEALTNRDIVLYALLLLGGTKQKVFTEDVAKKCFEISSSRFSWRKYPEYPDIETVRLRLKDAKNKWKLVVGRAGEVKGLKPSDGWIFTPNGISWIEKNRPRIIKSLGEPSSPVVRTDLDKKINQLINSDAYLKFIKDKGCKNIKPYEFTDFLNASLDTPVSILHERIIKYRVLAAAAKKQKLLDFIEQCEKIFSLLLTK